VYREAAELARAQADARQAAYDAAEGRERVRRAEAAAAYRAAMIASGARVRSVSEVLASAAAVMAIEDSAVVLASGQPG
jgi:hypothetical protein